MLYEITHDVCVDVSNITAIVKSKKELSVYFRELHGAGQAIYPPHIDVKFRDDAERDEAFNRLISYANTAQA